MEGRKGEDKEETGGDWMGGRRDEGRGKGEGVERTKKEDESSGGMKIGVVGARWEGRIWW